MTPLPSIPEQGGSSHGASDVPLGPVDERMMALLGSHVPLSLLLDLSAPDGPASREILDSEGRPDQSWWLPRS